MLFPTFHTGRLMVRQFVADDWPALLGYTSDADVMRYIPEGVFGEAEARAFTLANSGADATAVAVTSAHDHALLGHVLFHPWYAPHTFELGWVFDPRYQGQGYATEAAAALRDYGFGELELHRIIATCQPENPASYRVMEKLGMRREGHFRQCIYRGGEVWWDEYFYAILRSEWQSLKD